LLCEKAYACGFDTPFGTQPPARAVCAAISRRKNMKTANGVFHVKLSVLTCIVLASMLACLSGCAGEPPAQIRKKLDVVVENDFRAITGEVAKENLADSVYRRVVEYKDFDKGQYRVKAVVDFFYIKGVNVKRTVKYRYVKSAGKWERYANDYVHF
jgi:hypothetical protein